jgi:lysophospholipase L1-like esterase
LALATWKKRLLAVALGLLFALAFLEVALRVVGVSFQDFYKADSVRGVAHRPGARGWFRREGRQYIVINRDGFRDRDHPSKKPPGTYRIAILGDSFTEGLQVRLEDTFGAVLERNLSTCSDFRSRSIEVDNFGVSNYGTAQELLTLRDRVWATEPDLVLLAFFTGNDIWDNSRELKKDPEIPYFRLENDALVLDDSFRDSPRQRAEGSMVRQALRQVVETSRLLQVIRQAWGVARNRSAATPFQGDEFASNAYQRQLYREPTDHAWQDAWAVTERILRTIRDEAKARGAKFAVVTLTNGVQVHPDPTLELRLEQSLGVADLDYPDRRLNEIGARAGFEVLNLAPAFRQQARENHVFYHGFEPNLGTGHWNERGHELAGQLIARWLCARADFMD